MLIRPNHKSRFIKSLVMAQALAVALWVMPVASPVAPLASSAQAAQRGPDSLADVVEQVLDAVVNISASTTVNEQQRSVQVPQLPPGSPFQDFFDEFFGPNGPNGGQGGKGQQRKSSSLGSGFIIDPAGIVVTNNHVIGDANEITVILTDGTRLKAEVVGKDAKVDLAVLRVKPEKPLKSVKFGDSEKARLGDWVIAIGNPFGLGGSVTAGIVSARNRDMSDNSYGQYIQTDAAINKGNSGGPLFNMQGEVIGVNTAILSPSGGSIGIGFSVPSGMAKPVIEQLIQYGETAGIEAGDVIIKFDGHEVKDSKDLPRLVGQTAVGKSVDVVVLRKGKELTKTAKLERLAETDPQAKAAGNKAPDVTLNRKFAGLELSPMNDDLRKRYSIKDSVKGVVVTKVEPNSTAAEKRIALGDVIMEVQQDQAATPEAVMKKIDALKKDGKKSVLLLIVNAQGDTRFVALPLD